MHNDDNPDKTETLNGTDSTGFIVAMEKEIETLIAMQAFAVVDKEPWMNIVSSVWFSAAQDFLVE